MKTINEQKEELLTILESRKTINTQKLELSKRINNIKRAIYRRESPKYHKEKPYENEECFLLFGKHYKDLSHEELKKYNALRQKKSREFKNGNVYSLVEIYEKFYKNKWNTIN